MVAAFFVLSPSKVLYSAIGAVVLSLVLMFKPSPRPLHGRVTIRRVVPATGRQPRNAAGDDAGPCPADIHQRAVACNQGGDSVSSRACTGQSAACAPGR